MKHPFDFSLFDMHPFIILRHGQSQWNLEDRFTGWNNVPLTEEGRQEARKAAKVCKIAGIEIDEAHTSLLDRAIETLEIFLRELENTSISTFRSWRLNERHYGCLQGLKKVETARQLGLKTVMGWRRSYFGRPPSLEMDDHRHPRFDPHYAHIPIEYLPRTESLADTERRLLPYWQEKILPSIILGKRIIIVAHGNSLRALVRYLENTSVALVPELVIPTGVPLQFSYAVETGTYQRIKLPNSIKASN